jgi:hypothetical protein
MKAQRVERRNANDFLTLPAQSKSSVKVAFPPRARRLISHFPNDFRSLSHKRVSMSCFLLSAVFGLPSLARPCSYSAVSVVGFGCSVAFDYTLHSKFFDLLCSFSPF